MQDVSALTRTDARSVHRRVSPSSAVHRRAQADAPWTHCGGSTGPRDVLYRTRYVGKGIPSTRSVIRNVHTSAYMPPNTPAKGGALMGHVVHAQAIKGSRVLCTFWLLCACCLPHCWVASLVVTDNTINYNVSMTREKLNVSMTREGLKGVIARES